MPSDQSVMTEVDYFNKRRTGFQTNVCMQMNISILLQMCKCITTNDCVKLHNRLNLIVRELHSISVINIMLRILDTESFQDRRS